MTVIAYRDGAMASDTGVWRGNAAYSRARKLVRGDDGTLYGLAGSACRSQAFIEWVEMGCEGGHPQPVIIDQANNVSDFLVLVAKPTGGVEIWDGAGVEKHDTGYFAIGACDEVCLGAMFAGADAETAIRAALEHGSGAHGRVEVIRR